MVIGPTEKKQGLAIRFKQSIPEICSGRSVRVNDRGEDHYGTPGQVTCAGVRIGLGDYRRISLDSITPDGASSSAALTIAAAT
jgi:hypothetical protein